MPTVTLTKATKRSVSVVVRDGDTTTHRLTLNPDNPTSRAAVCRAVRCDDSVLLGWLDGMDRSPEDPRRFVADLGGGATTAPKHFRVQGFDGVVHATHPQASLAAVLPTVPVDTLLAWDDADALCCLDVDYHGDARPPRRETVEAWADRLAPAPLVWHLSRGGGVHAFYAAQPPFTAKMLASAAALRWASIDPTAGLELKTQVRGAGAEKLHVAPGGQDTLGVLSKWIGRDTVEADDIADWLAANDMAQGQRYPHSRCPIDPTDTGERDPVTVGEKGIFCHRCHGKGLGLGSRSPGFAPWAALCGAPSGGEVGSLVRNMAHWGHARLVLIHRYGLPEALARPAYEAALLAANPTREAAVPSAFNPDTADLVRVNDSWVSINSGITFGNRIDPMLATLPQCLVPGDEGKLKVQASTVSLLGQAVDLTDRGYKNVEVIHGYQFAKQFLPPPAATQVPVVHRSLREKGPQWQPRYVPRAGRKSVDWAWGVLEGIFPKVHKDLIRAMLCAIGTARETKLGLQPILFVAGAAASAKTMSAVLAASIAGSESAAVTYTQDEARFRQAVRECAEKGCLIRADEFLKESKRALKQGWSPKAAMEPLLTLTPRTLCHVLYAGPRPLGCLPALVITETSCPAALKDFTQISRRVRYAPLYGRRNWKEPMAAVGLTGDTMPRLRLVSAEVNEACDVIVSDVTDEFFCTPTTWDAQADRCGFPTIEDSRDFINPEPALLRFYQLVCQMPAQTDKHATRHKAKDGWRRISRHEAGTPDAQELLDLFDGFSDEQGPRWGQSVVLQEKSWGDLLKVDHYVTLDIHSEGGSVAYVRFRFGQPHALVKVNGQIKDPAELEIPT